MKCDYRDYEFGEYKCPQPATWKSGKVKACDEHIGELIEAKKHEVICIQRLV